jgi:hypothetical protein
MVEEDPAACHRIKTMRVVEILSVSTHAGTTQAVECLGGLLAPRCRGFYARGTVVDSND